MSCDAYRVLVICWQNFFLLPGCTAGPHYFAHFKLFAKSFFNPIIFAKPIKSPRQATYIGVVGHIAARGSHIACINSQMSINWNLQPEHTTFL